MKRLPTRTLLASSTVLLALSAAAQIEIIDKKEGEASNKIEIITESDPAEPGKAPADGASPTSDTSDAAPSSTQPSDTPPAKEATSASRAIDTEALRRPGDPGNDQAMIVLDASGSMWGQIDKVTKIAIARDVVGEVLGNWGESTDLGLVAYGHRKKGECADIETLIAPGKLDAARFTTTVGQLKPKGKTPLTQAVIDAAEELKYTENKATVILISDGEETCNLDPCKAGQSLEELGIEFTAHVISFDVPEEKVAGMRCLAEATGGRFLQADDASELKDALQKAVVVTTDNAPPDESPATVRVPDSVVAGAAFDVDWSGPKNRSDRLVIVDPDAKKAYRYVHVGDADITPPTELEAPETPGNYVVRYQTREQKVLGEAKLVVVAAEASVSAPPSVVAGSKFDVEWTGPKNTLDRLQIFGADGKKQYGQTYVYQDESVSPSELEAPEAPGDYELRYYTKGEITLARTTFTVVAAEASVSAPPSVVAGSKFDVEWTGPKNTLDRLQIFGADGKKQYGQTYVYQDKSVSPSEVEAPEATGDYELRYFTKGESTLARTTLSVVAAEASVSAPASVVAGSKFDVEWTGPKNELDQLIIFSTDGKKKYGYTYIYQEKSVSPSEIEAPETPGDYELRYYTKGESTLARANITVIAAEASVSAPASVIAGSKFGVEWVGPKNELDRLMIFSADGKKQFDSTYIYQEESVSPSEIKAPEAPGDYELRYYTKGESTLAHANITVVAAKTSVSAPASVVAGALFAIEWMGPKNDGDHLRIFSADGKKKYEYSYIYENATVSPTEIVAPNEAGSYEVRYVTRGDNTLATTKLIVTAP